jgi:hypothetical protein
MRVLFASLFFAFIFGCTQKDKQTDSSTSVPSDTTKTDTATQARSDSDSATLKSLSIEILSCLKNGDYKCLAAYVHPTLGVRFSPYAAIDTSTDKVFTKSQIEAFASSKKKINWGAYSAGEEEIVMTPAEYAKDFIYDVDFLNATEVSFNKTKTRGTMMNNVDEIYTSHKYFDFFVPGTDPKFEGMDWRALRLVYKQDSGKYYLVGIIHDEWTS